MAKLRSSSEIVLSGRSSAIQAAPPPFPMNNGGRNGFGYSNILIKSATQSTDRESVSQVDYDFHQTITPAGRRTLMNLGRAMFWQIPPLQSAILEQANLAASPFSPMFMGRDKEWGDQALEWLKAWHQVMCVEGWPYDYDVYCEQQIVSGIVDGQLHSLATEDASGNPRMQFIPAHRIGLRYQANGIARVVYENQTLAIDGKVIDPSLPYSFSGKVEFDAQIVDGCIVDAQNRPIAYRVYGVSKSSTDFLDLPARSCFPFFFPLVTGQITGVSLLASSIFDWQDWREFRKFEQLAQKAFSTKTLVETNETGEADPAKALIQAQPTFNTDNSLATLATQKLDGGQLTYLRARSGSKLEAFNWQDRPGRNSLDFSEMTLRDAMAGSEWSMFFSLDPKNVGGAPMRVIVDRLNRVLKKRRRTLGKHVLRTDVYALAKAIKNGDLPWNVDWYKWAYQGGADITADRRYDAQTDQAEYQIGWMTMEDAEGRRNGNWLAKREQKEREVRDLYTRARAISTEFGIPIQEAAAQISSLANAFINLGEQVGDADLKDGITPAANKQAPTK